MILWLCCISSFEWITLLSPTLLMSLLSALEFIPPWSGWGGTGVQSSLLLNRRQHAGRPALGSHVGVAHSGAAAWWWQMGKPGPLCLTFQLIHSVNSTHFPTQSLKTTRSVRDNYSLFIFVYTIGFHLSQQRNKVVKWKRKFKGLTWNNNLFGNSKTFVFLWLSAYDPFFCMFSPLHVCFRERYSLIVTPLLVKAQRKLLERISFLGGPEVPQPHHVKTQKYTGQEVRHIYIQPCDYFKLQCCQDL